MMQNGYVDFDKDNLVTEILKCSVGKLRVLGTRSTPANQQYLRLNYLQAVSFSENAKSALVSFLFRFSHHQILFLVAKWDRWQAEDDDTFKTEPERKQYKHNARCIAGELSFLQFVPSVMQPWKTFFTMLVLSWHQHHHKGKSRVGNSEGSSSQALERFCERSSSSLTTKPWDKQLPTKSTKIYKNLQK